MEKLNKNLGLLLGSIPYLKWAKGELAICNIISLELNVLSRLNKLKCVWFHVPNERVNSSISTLRNLFAIGMVAGVPDYIFLSENKCLAVEVKCDKKKLSPKQELFANWLKEQKIPFYLVRSWKELAKVLEKHEMICEK